MHCQSLSYAREASAQRALNLRRPFREADWRENCMKGAKRLCNFHDKGQVRLKQLLYWISNYAAHENSKHPWHQHIHDFHR
jgi:hypothetical protein